MVFASEFYWLSNDICGVLMPVLDACVIRMLVDGENTVPLRYVSDVLILLSNLSNVLYDFQES